MYDYIVVGAGSAGCAIAARLSEDPNTKVLLLEAGGDNREEHMYVPAMFGQCFKTAHDWDFYSEPEPHLGMRKNYLPRGRGLGGTSSLNGMVYIRGHRRDFDEWRDLGHPGWGYDDVLPYFKRAEGNERGASEFHGGDGPLKISDLRYHNELTTAWVESALAAGYESNPDFNGAEQEGVGWYQVCQNAGERWSTASAYVYPALQRPNFEVLSHSTATKILFDGERAIGVEIERFGLSSGVFASREVIVSGGVYNTPKLLLLSGVGPAGHLGDMGIECRVDLPVGEGLQDHPGVFLMFGTDTHTMRTDGTAENLELWRSERQGPLTSNVVESGGFFRSDPELEFPDVQTTIMPIGWADEGVGLVTEDQFMVLQWLLRPTSRGTVRLRSPMASSKPRITHNHLQTAADIKAMTDGLRLNMRIAAHDPLRGHQRSVQQSPSSPDADDAEFEQFLRRYVLSCYHATSSCQMGEVVDSELRVFGVDGLRIVDGSVMPRIVGGNPQASVIMIAEKAADLVKAAAGGSAATASSNGLGDLAPEPEAVHG
jgi:choline dehydrogenase